MFTINKFQDYAIVWSFTSGQLWRRSSSTTQSKRKQYHCSFWLFINSLPSAAVHAKGPHKAPTGAPGTPKAYIILSSLINNSQMRLLPCTCTHVTPQRLPERSITLQYTTAKNLIKLTVGEGEAWSEIVFCDSCMKAANKEVSVGWETEPSHTHCPHASSGPPANLQYLPFKFLGNSWRASFF